MPDKMDRAIAKLVLNQPFYAALALRLKREKDPQSKAAVWVDGVTMGYHPDKCEALNDDELTGLVCRLVEGLAHLHHTRRETRMAAVWNKASAHVCCSLVKECGFTLPREDRPYATGAYDGKSVEGAYALLMRLPPGKGGGKGGSSQGNGAGTGEVRDCPMDGAASGQHETEWKQATFQAARVAQAQGNCPDHVKLVLEDITNPQVPWADELREFVSRLAHERYQWTRPNRRYVWRGIYLPSRRSKEVGDLVLAIDTSGSVAGIIGKFAGEISGLLQDNPSARVQILYCDARCHEGPQVTVEDCPLKLEPIGGGGTDFRPVFDWVDRNCQQPPKALIYLTDLCGRFPDAAPGYPVLWACINQRQAPFGRTVHVPEIE